MRAIAWPWSVRSAAALAVWPALCGWRRSDRETWVRRSARSSSVIVPRLAAAGEATRSPSASASTGAADRSPPDTVMPVAATARPDITTAPRTTRGATRARRAGAARCLGAYEECFDTGEQLTGSTSGEQNSDPFGRGARQCCGIRTTGHERITTTMTNGSRRCKPSAPIGRTTWATPRLARLRRLLAALRTHPSQEWSGPFTSFGADAHRAGAVQNAPVRPGPRFVQRIGNRRRRPGWISEGVPICASRVLRDCHTIGSVVAVGSEPTATLVRDTGESTPQGGVRVLVVIHLRFDPDK